MYLVNRPPIQFNLERQKDYATQSMADVASAQFKEFNKNIRIPIMASVKKVNQEFDVLRKRFDDIS